MSPITLGRAFIAINAIAASTNALLIGIKYACTRRQFESATNKN
jgi:alkylation response protein AidB-like acyl-CoA dehydrogenase